MHKGSLDLLNAQISMRGDLDYARTNGHSRLLLNVKNWYISKFMKFYDIIVCERGCSINFNELRETMH